MILISYHFLVSAVILNYSGAHDTIVNGRGKLTLYNIFISVSWLVISVVGLEGLF